MKEVGLSGVERNAVKRIVASRGSWTTHGSTSIQTVASCALGAPIASRGSRPMRAPFVGSYSIGKRSKIIRSGRTVIGMSKIKT
eukprot:scaffold133101_cov37-Tisochrysis_lutea.AAC.3